MARGIACAAIVLLALVAVASAEGEASKGRQLLQGWPWPRVSATVPTGKLKIAPYAWSVGNIVGGNVLFPNVYLTGKGGRKLKSVAGEDMVQNGRQLLQGWPWPRVSATVPTGKLKIAPYAWSVGNIVGGNVLFPNVYLTGKGGK